jgi:hypothetical protein
MIGPIAIRIMVCQYYISSNIFNRKGIMGKIDLKGDSKICMHLLVCIDFHNICFRMIF